MKSSNQANTRIFSEIFLEHTNIKGCHITQIIPLVEKPATLITYDRIKLIVMG